MEGSSFSVCQTFAHSIGLFDSLRLYCFYQTNKLKKLNGACRCAMRFGEAFAWPPLQRGTCELGDSGWWVPKKHNGPPQQMMLGAFEYIL